MKEFYWSKVILMPVDDVRILSYKAYLISAIEYTFDRKYCLTLMWSDSPNTDVYKIPSYGSIYVASYSDARLAFLTVEEQEKYKEYITMDFDDIINLPSEGLSDVLPMLQAVVNNMWYERLKRDGESPEVYGLKES
jgi:hypothetical protein